MNDHRCQNIKRTLTIAVATAIGSFGAAAVAQSDLVLEEVVVTAQKRDQSLQDVPSSVSVVSGSSLDDFQLKNFADLEQLTPGLVTDNLDSRSGSISLRGIDYNPNSAAAQAVDAYWNDTPVSAQGGGVFQQIFDLERIEVLKGPQGTLQGKSSPAGAIMLHTAKPDMEELEGNVSAQVTDNSGFNTSAAVSIPIIPGKLSTRIAGVFDQSDLDEAENIVTGNSRDKETWAGRISVAWLATDRLSLDFAYQYLDNETTEFNILQGSSLTDPTLPTLKASDRKGIQQNDAEGDATYQRASLGLTYELDNHRIDWLSGWSDVDSYVDGENLNSEGIQDPAESQRQILEDDFDAWSQEIRISNTDGDFWEYIVGFYAANEEGDFIRHDFRTGGLPDRDRVILTPFENEYLAAFTHNIFHLSESWTAQLGLRWQNRESSITSDIYAGPQGLFGLPEGTFFASLIPEDAQNTDEDAVTGSANLQYHFNEPDLMVYGSYSTGYRPGGVTVAPADLGDLVVFDEEDSWSFEVGFKSTLLDGRASLNGAAFYQEFDDYITRVSRVSISTSNNSVGITDNADAEVTGLELDFNAVLTENWVLGGGLSYVQAEFASGEELVCTDLQDGVPVIPEGEIAATCSVGGNALGPQPEWSAGLNTEYTVPFSSFEGYVRALYKYTGEREDVDIDGLDAYQTLDLFLGIRAESQQWDIGLFARNLFDEDQIIRGNAPGLHRQEPTGYQAVDVVSPRLIGLTASYNF
jgi:iron complex outermembrane recepter protein